MHFHIPRGYLYFAVAFSGVVEMLNQRVAGKRTKRIAAKISALED
jgi:predicted tellurium resistance membrane protein TerC